MRGGQIQNVEKIGIVADWMSVGSETEKSMLLLYLNVFYRYSWFHKDR